MEAPFTPEFFRRLQQLKIHTRRSFLGSRQGSHLSKRKGHGLEFADYRPYAPGDDFRHIDWGVYGRTDRLYVRQFREEQDLNVSVLLDTSASMAFPKKKFELAVNLGIALGFVALSEGDSMRYTLLGQERTPTYSGASATSRIYNNLKQFRAEGTFDFKRELVLAASQSSYPGKCFLISDFLLDPSEIIAGIKGILAKNFELALVQILSPDELKLPEDRDELMMFDSETKEAVQISIGKEARKTYNSRLAEHINTLEDFCQSAGVSYLLVSSEESLESIVLGKFPKKGFIL